MSTSVEKVLEWSERNGEPPATGPLAMAVAAVNALAARRCYDYAGQVPPVAEPADFVLALTMQAYRLSKRSTSPEGLISDVGELGVNVAIARWDPDIERLLADHLKPAIA